jgi:hypothetical protein
MPWYIIKFNAECKTKISKNIYSQTSHVTFQGNIEIGSLNTGSQTSHVTFQGNIEIGSHETGLIDMKYTLRGKKMVTKTGLTV